MLELNPTDDKIKTLEGTLRKIASGEPGWIEGDAPGTCYADCHSCLEFIEIAEKALQEFDERGEIKMGILGTMPQRGDPFVKCDNSVPPPWDATIPILAPACHDAGATRRVTITYNMADIDVLFLCRACARNIGKWARLDDYKVEIVPLFTPLPSG